MKTGVQFHKKLNIENIRKAGFERVEYAAEDFLCLSEEKRKEQAKKLPISGIEVELDGLDAQKLFEAMVAAEQSGAEYILIRTVNCTKEDILSDMIEECSMAIADFEGEIYVENGMSGDDFHGYTYNPFSSTEKIKEICAYGNQIVGKNVFKVALNIGYGNLLEKNVRRMIDELGDMLALVHVNDNDGRSNLRQMPYTFTTGRGAPGTDWKRILGALIKIPFDGWIIFDTVGLFERIPEELQLSMLSLLKEIEKSWMKQFRFEDILNQPDKQLVLFGAGMMAYNFLQVWGDRYKPAFLVDNNSKVWGQYLEGIEVKSPEAILQIPKEQQLVLICNTHYNEIKAQLTGMGISYEYYNDEYYM